MDDEHFNSGDEQYRRKLESEIRQAFLFKAEAERSAKLKVAFIVVIVGFLGAVGSGISLFHILKSKPLPDYSIEVLPQYAVQIRTDVDHMKKDLVDIKAAQSASNTSSGDGVLAENQEKLTVLVKSIDKRLSSLESAILETPEKALSIPLLRKDILDITKRDDEHKVMENAEINRLYEQQKWILGGIAVFMFSLITGASTLILKLYFTPKTDG